MKAKQILFPMMAGVAAFAALTTATRAQSSDALLDKLVDKGILTVKEANELKEEADKGYSQAYQVKSGMPDWVTSFKINGDVRGRYESFRSDNTNFNPRDRFRYRLRVGGVATLKDDFEVGFRLTSSEANGSFGGDPISGNTTMNSGGSKKFVYIDLAYGKWKAWGGPAGSETLIIGKMENPFVFSDMVFDADYTPEGAASQTVFNINDQHALKLNVGAFALREINQDSINATSNQQSSHDSYMAGAQLRLDSTWNKKIATSLGLSGLSLLADESLGAAVGAGADEGSSNLTERVPNVNAGNTRTLVSSKENSLVYNYNPVIADASFTYTLESFPMYNGAFPVKLFSEFMENQGAATQNQAYQVGVTFGKSGKKGLWDITYRFKELQGDAWYEEFVDSDFGAYYPATQTVAGATRTRGLGLGKGYQSGTNVRGHIIKATYSPYDSLTLGVTAFLTEVIDTSYYGGAAAAAASQSTDMLRLQVDAVWKF